MFFFRKKKQVNPLDLPLIEEIELKPYSQVRYDLIYANNQVLVDNEDVFICVRRYKNTLLKFMMIHNEEAVKSYSLNSESLKEYASKHANLVDIDIKDLDLEKEVQTHIFYNTTQRLKEYAYINATADKKRYIQYYFFNHQTNKLEVYRKLKDIDTLIAEAKTALYFDLACIDKEA